MNQSIRFDFVKTFVDQFLPSSYDFRFVQLRISGSRLRNKNKTLASSASFTMELGQIPFNKEEYIETVKTFE